MQYVIAAPEYVAAAATDLANIGSAINTANSAAQSPTSRVLAAGADEVSVSIAALFDAHAAAYQALSAQAALFHQQFVELMNGGAAQYALTEAANASPLQSIQQGVLSQIGSPSQALSTGSSLAGTAAPASSVATGLPAAAAGLSGGSTGHLAAAVSPPLSAVSALPPAGTPLLAAAPTGSAALTSASAPAAALQAQTPAYAPATAAAAVPAEPAIPAAASTPAAEAETAAFSPAAGLPAAIPAPAGASVAAAPAYRPATPAYSTSTGVADSPGEQSAV
jgi:hypothetical protein